MQYDSLPPSNHVVRHVGLRCTIRDDNENVVGIRGDAFEVTDDNPELSVTWVEHFAGNWNERVRAAYTAMCKRRTLGKKGVLAWAMVEEIVRDCARYDCSVRILHDPEEDNTGHSLILHLRRDRADLLDHLASDTFGEFVLLTTLSDASI